VGSFASHTDYHYQTLRCNVDLLKIIQLGITFADESGELADDCPTWQFNFKFNLQEDMYAQDSIDLLTRSGIEFRNHEEHGIEVDAVSGRRRRQRWRPWEEEEGQGRRAVCGCTAAVA
jgi:CCR4-NOT transcription complex subunit 7/8